MDYCKKIIFFVLFISNNSFGNINDSKYKEILIKIDNICKKYPKIHCPVFKAILYQESKFKLDAINKKSLDLGISQINYRTAILYKFTLHKLLNDLEYSIEAGAIVLNDLRKSYGKKEVDYWTRYNSNKPHLREIYKERVKQWIN